MRRVCSVFLEVSEETMVCVLDVSEETMFCVTERICRDYVLCFWTYLRRLCSVLLHVSAETMFCVSGRI